MPDLAIENVRRKLEELHKKAKDRRGVSNVDPVADAIDFCVGEIASTLETTAEEERYVTPAQFARMQRPRRNVQTVRRWIREGRLEAIPKGRSYVIRQDARVTPPAHLERTA